MCVNVYVYVYVQVGVGMCVCERTHAHSNHMLVCTKKLGLTWTAVQPGRVKHMSFQLAAAVKTSE